LSLRYLISAFFLLATVSVHAAEPQSCQNSLDLALADPPEQSETDGDDTVQLEVGRFDANLGAEASATMSGGILLRQGEQLAGADSAIYNPLKRELKLEGDVRYEDPGAQISGDAAEFSYDTGRIQFSGAEFALGANNARGGATSLLITREGELQLDDVRYTTCPPGSNDWELQAADIDLDTRAGVGTARHIRLRFQGVPILWAPYISFPAGDARKSGILTPEIGSSTRGGNEIQVPYYWNIAPNYDATFTPRLLTDRGLQVQTDFRYLSRLHDGQLIAQVLPNDNAYNDELRSLLAVEHRSLLTNGLRGLLSFREVSDDQYFEDLGGSLSESSTTHLNRYLAFDWHSDTLSAFLRVQDYQTLDSAIPPTEEPYQRLPQLVVSGYWPDSLAMLTTSINAEVVNFDREVGITGWRANIAPKFELPVTGRGWFFTPALAWDYTRYQLDNTLPGDDQSVDRSLPIASVDTGLVLERTMRSSAARLQTLEPRMLYVHIPFEDQSQLPVFDTIVPDLNLVQLFRTNRYLGIDRIGDTNQLSLGITSRITDASSGQELVTATVGQTQYFGDREVTLPGDEPIRSESSDYIAEIRFFLYDHWNFDFGHQWGTGENGTTQSEARLQYRPSGNKILNMAYRYRRDSLEQADVSWSWPLGSKWNFVGRYNYSLRDQTALEQFYGLEYESCCWGLRLITRRYISTRDGTQDSSVGLQLVLKGMTNVGTAAGKLLERGILGYSAGIR
jgi:LPS-assembly protein